MTKITQIKQYIIYQKLTDKSPATLISYRSDLIQFAIWFEKINNTEMDLLHITPTDARKYKQYLIDSNFRPQTINRRLLSLKYFCYCYIYYLNKTVQASKSSKSTNSYIKKSQGV
jgi:integrase/recombinase XerC